VLHPVRSLCYMPCVRRFPLFVRNSLVLALALVLLSACGEDLTGNADKSAASTEPSAIPPAQPDRNSQCYLGALPPTFYKSEAKDDELARLKWRYADTAERVTLASTTDFEDFSEACQKKFNSLASPGLLPFKAAPISMAARSITYEQGLRSEHFTTVIWGCYGSCSLLKE